MVHFGIDVLCGCRISAGVKEYMEQSRKAGDLLGDSLRPVYCPFAQHWFFPATWDNTGLTQHNADYHSHMGLL